MAFDTRYSKKFDMTFWGFGKTIFTTRILITFASNYSKSIALTTLGGLGNARGYNNIPPPLPHAHVSLTPNMALRSGSRNRNGMFDTCSLFGVVNVDGGGAAGVGIGNSD